MKNSKSDLFIAILLLFSVLLSIGCSDPNTNQPKDGDEANNNLQYFQEIPSNQSGIQFENTLIENQQYNFMRDQGMLVGGGVGILDVNKDGLQDIYFAGNMVSDRLYLNKGHLKFEDITISAGIQHINWSTGVAIVDINADGYDDIYVCKYIGDQPQQRQNLLYINNKDNTYTEAASKYGIADQGYSIMANFLDYDRDGDLDLYIANQPPNSRAFRAQYNGVNDFRYTDKLYRNDGGQFTDKTESSGIKNYSYSLSATTLDFNKDGWPDLYVACDYDEPDFFYKNNGNGTFTNVSNEVLRHMSNFSMGADVADINNDGEIDLFVADMVAEDNFRQKTNMSGMDPARFQKLVNTGFHYQYMYNVLQVNNGDNSFSDVAQLAGVSNTDWSWSPLFIDIDQDGYKDLTVTNGIYREIRNKDYEKWRIKWFEDFEKASKKNLAHTMNPMDVINKAPSVKVANYAYRNNGDLTFTKKSEAWGLSKKNWSQGSAYADFDNDGDVDLVISNTNLKAELYQNMANEKTKNNWLKIKLEGDRLNKNGHNTYIEVHSNVGIQSCEMTPYRGYMSSSERVAHFGLGTSNIIKEIRVIWSDNKMNVLNDITTNQSIIIKKKEATQTHVRGKKKDQTLFETLPTLAKHLENDYDDYEKEILLPYKTSHLGPSLAIGDINGDNKPDVYLGGSVGHSGLFLINKSSENESTFEKINGPLKQNRNDKIYEDGGIAFFDLDDDGDTDMYISSGGNEYPVGSPNYKDRLYINNGKGQFKKSTAHPSLNGSNGAILALDYDKDGDTDLIVAGRLIPAAYGQPASSHLLENRNGQLVDVTDTKARILKDIGMVTDMKAVDLDNDGNPEIIMVGEWMPIKIMAISDTLKDVSKNYNLEHTTGWWNTLAVADLDNDGDLDFIAGNLGYNIKYKASQAEPFKLYVDDFDNNGSNDVYLGFYENGQCFPVRGRQCSSEQMPFVSEKFENYNAFGSATITDILDNKISESTTVHEAETFASSVFINDGKASGLIPLPSEAQVFPIYGIALDDFDKDGHIDALLAGNMLDREVETTRSDAGKGLMISFMNDGKMTTTTHLKTGINANKNTRNVKILKSEKVNHLFIANNNDVLQMFKY